MTIQIDDVQRSWMLGQVVEKMASMIRTQEHFKNPTLFMAITDLNSKLKGVHGEVMTIGESHD